MIPARRGIFACLLLLRKREGGEVEDAVVDDQGGGGEAVLLDAQVFAFAECGVAPAMGLAKAVE
jgi:hypothetical protein